MTSLKKFLRDEAGVVTLEWVAIGASVAVLALGVVVTLQPGIGEVVIALVAAISNL